MADGTKYLPHFLVLALIGGAWAYWGEDVNPFASAPVAYIDAEPLQTETKTPPFRFKSYGFFPRLFFVTPLADYEITGRVLGKRRYFSQELKADLVPYDMGLGWKTMSDLKILGSLKFKHKTQFGGRYLWFSYGDDQEKRAFFDIKHLSNNHLIPSTKEIFSRIGESGTGDIVKIKGYLVKIESPEDPSFIWQSSLSRTDDSDNWAADNTSCETIFVTGFEVVDK